MSRLANTPIIYVYYTFSKDGSIDKHGLVRARSKSHVAEWLRKIDVQTASAEDVARLMTAGCKVEDIFEENSDD